jgi:hypothetical protein
MMRHCKNCTANLAAAKHRRRKTRSGIICDGLHTALLLLQVGSATMQLIESAGKKGQAAFILSKFNQYPALTTIEI